MCKQYHSTIDVLANVFIRILRKYHSTMDVLVNVFLEFSGTSTILCWVVVLLTSSVMSYTIFLIWESFSFVKSILPHWLSPRMCDSLGDCPQSLARIEKREREREKFHGRILEVKFCQFYA